MGKIDGAKTIKIGVGCCISFLIAEKLGLRYSNSVITITLLSILSTRRDTFRTAGKRWMAFALAILVGAVTFGILPVGEYPYMAINLLLYLTVFLMLCQKLRLMEGFSMSTVLMLHLWREPQITLRAVGNEAALMTIGIFMGIAANLYMPNRVSEIRKAQRQVEDMMRRLFLVLAREIQGTGQKDHLYQEALQILKELKHLLRKALLHAEYTEKNYVFKNSHGDYYSKYMEMREEQRQLLKRISLQIHDLHGPYAQSELVAGLMRRIAGSLEEHNNAQELLNALESVRAQCRQQELPRDREEFEDRARLFGIVGLLRELLQVKQEFSASLTKEEIVRFWKFFLP